MQDRLWNDRILQYSGTNKEFEQCFTNYVKNKYKFSVNYTIVLN